MITIISGTNRPNSNTAIFAKYYYQTIKRKAKGETVQLVDLKDINATMLQEGKYHSEAQSTQIVQWQDEKMLPAKKFVFVMPEYNGSYPGILKLFMDALSIRKYAKTFNGKNALLAGVSTGRAGCLRGMDHFADILMHVGTSVHPNKMPYSEVGAFISDGKLTDKTVKETIRKHVDSFL